MAAVGDLKARRKCFYCASGVTDGFMEAVDPREALARARRDVPRRPRGPGPHGPGQPQPDTGVHLIECEASAPGLIGFASWREALHATVRGNENARFDMARHVADRLLDDPAERDRALESHAGLRDAVTRAGIDLESESGSTAETTADSNSEVGVIARGTSRRDFHGWSGESDSPRQRLARVLYGRAATEELVDVTSRSSGRARNALIQNHFGATARRLGRGRAAAWFPRAEGAEGYMVGNARRNSVFVRREAVESRGRPVRNLDEMRLLASQEPRPGCEPVARRPARRDRRAQAGRQRPRIDTARLNRPPMV